MVNLNRIYTRTGDGGHTHLSDMSRAAKTDPRVEAYGDVDEANAIVGVALSFGTMPAQVNDVLRHVQNELFDVGADLSTPLVAQPKWEPLRIEQESIDRLEGWCDSFAEPLPNLASFILPGGGPAAAHLHQARTVVRRAERRAWAAAHLYGTQVAPEATEDSESLDASVGGVNPLAISYLNRLSDLLFILTRVVTGPEKEVLWVPGGERRPTDPKALRQRRRITGEE